MGGETSRSLRSADAETRVSRRNRKEGQDSDPSANWNFVRGGPPIELLKLPQTAPKKFSTRSTATAHIDVSAATNVFPCFRGGLLFRITDPADGGWYFYNDTADMEMYIEYHFGPDSVLDAARGVKVEPSSLPGTEGWVSASMTVFPDETLLFITGNSRVNGFRSVFRIAPLSDQVAQRGQHHTDQVVANTAEEMEVVAKLTAEMENPTEDEVVERCTRQMVPFVDLKFPPNAVSLFTGKPPVSSFNFHSQRQQQQQQQSSRSRNNNNNINDEDENAAEGSNPNSNSSPSGSTSASPDNNISIGGVGSSQSRLAMSQTVSEIAASASIVLDPINFDSDARDLHRRLPPIVWMRPHQFLTPEEADRVVTVSPNIDVHDIEPGFLGDIWLLSAIAGCLEVPVLIQWIFREGQVTNNSNSNNNSSFLSASSSSQNASATAAAAASSSSSSSSKSKNKKVGAALFSPTNNTSFFLSSSESALFGSTIKSAAGFDDEFISSASASPEGGTTTGSNSNINVKNKNVDVSSSSAAFLIAQQITQQENAVGAYRVCINVTGWWTSLVLDDYLPCMGNRPAFASNRRDKCELWPALLQKAFAKVYTSYAALSAGDPLLGYRTLTGCPTWRFDELWQEAIQNADDEKQVDSFFKKLLDWRDEGFLLSLNTRGVDSTFSHDLSDINQQQCQELLAKYEAIGLGLGHSYPVIDMHYFSQWKLFLFKLRNAWGTGNEWNGHWSDSSDLWDRFPDVTSVCKPENRDDGMFWMSWEDVRKYFTGGGVCFWRPMSWYDHRVMGQFVDSHASVCIELFIIKKTKLTISLSQSDSAMMPLAAMLLSIAAPLKVLLASIIKGNTNASNNNSSSPNNNNDDEENNTNYNNTTTTILSGGINSNNVLGNLDPNMINKFYSSFSGSGSGGSSSNYSNTSSSSSASTSFTSSNFTSSSTSNFSPSPSHPNRPHHDPKNTYVVTWNSTINADAPSENFTFTFARDLSIIVELEPSPQPYLIVPRVFDAGINKPYVLGIMSEHRCGSADSPFDARFVNVHQKSKFFKNRRLVQNPTNASRPINVPFQVKNEKGVREGIASGFRFSSSSPS